MNIETVIFGLFFGVIGLAIGMYRNKDKKGFGFLLTGIYKVAFYHRFEFFDEEEVEKRLVDDRERLENCYRSLDFARYNYLLAIDRQTHTGNIRQAISSLTVARKRFDESLGIAYLNGFGKTADKVKGQLKMRKNIPGDDFTNKMYQAVDAGWKNLPKFAQYQ